MLASVLSVQSVVKFFNGLSRHANHESQVEKQQRRGEKETIQKIERAADSREQIP
jgi:hypothetical protein